MCCTSAILRPGKGKHARFEWLHSNWNRGNRKWKIENRNLGNESSNEPRGPLRSDREERIEEKDSPDSGN
jgi:hypothetical protein